MKNRMNKQFQEISDEINKFETITRSEYPVDDRWDAQIQANKKLLAAFIKLHKQLSDMEGKLSDCILNRNA